jgi:hypothetical protein
MASSGIEEYIITNGEDGSAIAVQAFVDTLKDRIDKVKEKDDEFKIFAQEEKKATKRLKKTVSVDSDLSSFL